MSHHIFFVSDRIYHAVFFQSFFLIWNFVVSLIIFGQIYLRVNKYLTQQFLRMLFHCLLFLIVWDFPVVYFFYGSRGIVIITVEKTVGILIGFTDKIVDFFKTLLLSRNGYHQIWEADSYHLKGRINWISKYIYIRFICWDSQILWYKKLVKTFTYFLVGL